MLGLVHSSPTSKAATALLAAAGGSLPPLTALFHVGQFVRCVVLEPAAAEQQGAAAAPGGRRRMPELSLQLKRLHAGMAADAVAEGVALGACVRSVEDHGYTLGFGIRGLQVRVGGQGWVGGGLMADAGTHWGVRGGGEGRREGEEGGAGR